MLRVLLADDERWVREMLKSIINWGDVFACCGEASDGVQAYHLALNLRPDIVITDVRMPGMDGLAMIHQLSDLLPQTQIIVISGYDEFSYVKAAMDLSAIGYVLKPVKADEVNVLLEKAAEKINDYHIKQFAKESRLVAAEKVLQDFYNDIPTDEVWLERILADMGYYADYYGCLLIQNMQEDFDYETLRHKLSNALIDEEHDNHSLLFSLTLFLTGVLFVGKQPPDLSGMATRIMSNIKNKGGINGIGFAIGDVCDTPKSIKKTLETAKRGLLLIRPHESNEIILPGQEKPLDTTFPNHLENDLIHALYSANPAELDMVIKNIGAYFFGTTTTIADIKRILMIILGNIMRTAYKENAGDSVLNKGIELGLQINQMSSWKQIYHPFNTFCKTVHDSLTSHDGETLEKILKYLQSNFADNISLSKIAATHNMSQSNFSLTFKRHVGMTFTEYILKLRMERAKELLLQKKYKIHRISQMVGYEDSGYFGKLFKRYTGMLPNEFHEAGEDDKSI